MEGVAIVVSEETALSVEQVLEICQPLYPEKIGAMPIFKVSGIIDLFLIINTYKPKSIILAYPQLQTLLEWKHAPYTITYKTTPFGELNILTLPDITVWEKDRLIPALDRLEEIL